MIFFWRALSCFVFVYPAFFLAPVALISSRMHLLLQQLVGNWLRASSVLRPATQLVASDQTHVAARSTSLGMKTVSEFFGIPETDFENFRSDSPVTVFFGNGIGFRNFLSESAWCFTDRFHRLPVFVGNYWICVSEFSGIVSRNFFRNFPACDFFCIACTFLDKDCLFLYFLDTLRFF
jgi:hypothetical protein